MTLRKIVKSFTALATPTKMLQFKELLYQLRDALIYPFTASNQFHRNQSILPSFFCPQHPQ